MKKRKINENFILRVEMMVLIMISLIAVTIAWFVLSNRAQVKGMNLKAGDAEYIRVAVSENGPDVLELAESERYVEIGMPTFANTKTGQMAPGTYGEMKLYITALNPVVDGCSISVNSVPEYVDEDDTNVTQEEIEKLLKGHIQFYKNCSVDADGNRTYSGLITDESVYNVPLTEDEKEVTIYWVWPYEYTDVTDEAKEAFGTDMDQFFDKDKYDKSEYASGAYKEKQCVSFYDYGDTKLGMHVKNVYFHIYVNGLQYEAPESAGDAEDAGDTEDINAT